MGACRRPSEITRTRSELATLTKHSKPASVTKYSKPPSVTARCQEMTAMFEQLLRVANATKFSAQSV